MSRQIVFSQPSTFGPSFLSGRRGDETIRLDIPPGMRFLDCQLKVKADGISSAAYISSMPPAGAVGDLSVTVHWWYDLFSSISYELIAYAEPSSVKRGVVLLFEDVDFQGAFLTATTDIANLGSVLATPNGTWNDRVSSVVVVSGAWTLYADADFQAPYTANGAPLRLEVGHYPDVAALGVTNDSVSSLQVS